MAFETQGRDAITRIAGANLSTHQYKALALNGNGEVILPGTAGMKIIGVLQNKPASGKPASVMRDGISKMVAGAAVNLGAAVTTDTSGRVVTASTGNAILGYALLASTAADQLISVALGTDGAA